MKKISEEQKLLEEEGNNDCFIFDVDFNGKRLCIEASNDYGRLGRLINHNKKKTLPLKSISGI